MIVNYFSSNHTGTSKYVSLLEGVSVEKVITSNTVLLNVGSNGQLYVYYFSVSDSYFCMVFVVSSHNRLICGYNNFFAFTTIFCFMYFMFTILFHALSLAISYNSCQTLDT